MEDFARTMGPIIIASVDLVTTETIVKKASVFLHSDR